MLPLSNLDVAAPAPLSVDIDTEKLICNIRYLQKLTNKPVLASIKANGYGHGAEIAARAFLKGGASYLGVARLDEGLLLRTQGIKAPILIIGGLLADEMPAAVEASLEFFVWRPEHISMLRAIGTATPIKVHLKIDSGMGRLGCQPHEAVEFLGACRDLNGFDVVGLATHFASADQPDTATDVQIALFERVITALKDQNLCPPLIHAANSAGALYHPNSHYDMVRVGIAAYGEAPARAREPGAGLSSALSWRTRIVDTKILPKGHGVSYGGQYSLAKDQRIGVIPVGYGDGYRRILGMNRVLIEGQERHILGVVCMDHCMVDLDGFQDITGTEVILLGTQGDKTISATDIAERWGTIAYEVFTGIAARVPRRVISNV